MQPSLQFLLPLGLAALCYLCFAGEGGGHRRLLRVLTFNLVLALFLAQFLLRAVL